MRRDASDNTGNRRFGRGRGKEAGPVRSRPVPALGGRRIGKRFLPPSHHARFATPPHRRDGSSSGRARAGRAHSPDRARAAPSRPSSRLAGTHGVHAALKRVAGTPILRRWRGGRAANCTGLENRRVFTHVGSNPTPSARERRSRRRGGDSNPGLRLRCFASSPRLRTASRASAANPTPRSSAAPAGARHSNTGLSCGGLAPLARLLHRWREPRPQKSRLSAPSLGTAARDHSTSVPSTDRRPPDALRYSVRREPPPGPGRQVFRCSRGLPQSA